MQRAERATLANRQHARHIEETNQRASRIRKGLPGVWDWLSGKYRKIRKQNELETKQCARRDSFEKERLIQKHLTERQKLQQKYQHLRHAQKQEHNTLKRGFSQYMTPDQTGVQNQLNVRSQTAQPTQNLNHQHKKPGNDPEPDM